MVDNELLLCNFRRCRRPLDSVAWVTFCSHIFCPEDGKNLRQTPPGECPACGTKLTLQSDVLRVELDPTEQFKSMILAGLQPEVIMEVCQRGLAFWTYQVNQERTYQQHVVKRLRERMQEMQSYYEQVVRGRDDQLTAVRRQLEGARRDHEKCKEQREAVSERLAEKTRQYQRLQTLYDSLRKRAGPPTGAGWSSPSSSQPHPDPRMPFRCAAAIGPALYPPPSDHVSGGTVAAAAGAVAGVAVVAGVAGVGPRQQQCPTERQEGGGGGPLPMVAAPLGPASVTLAPPCSLALPANSGQSLLTSPAPTPFQQQQQQAPPSGFIGQQVPLPPRRSQGGVDPIPMSSTAMELWRGDSCESDFTFVPVTRRSIGTGKPSQK
ncbi:uncharacterized protein LOC122250799 [Penaeus japonicus]|uniref:uncharacterized protein LOC122250799 n=1 Tax=Penaeus japonicus TaxID=27405 RepID=UPI001C70F65A|nr:uncharacterized protein LOC122250799 [Penaeus japonicus]XP_042868363.1 uncharacterized protein LOC122250799 [Penaeus japonicus]